MFINRISNFSIDRVGRVVERVTTYGKYKGNSIAIDNWKYKDNTIEKRFVLWNDTWQVIINKIRGRNGKFERIG